jgi:hypothetical protein
LINIAAWPNLPQKEKILKTVEGPPDDSSFEEVMERLYLLYKIEKEIQQAEAGELITHAQAKKKLKKWLE